MINGRQHKPHNENAVEKWLPEHFHSQKLVCLDNYKFCKASKNTKKKKTYYKIAKCQNILLTYLFNNLVLSTNLLRQFTSTKFLLDFQLIILFYDQNLDTFSKWDILTLISKTNIKNIKKKKQIRSDTKRPGQLLNCNIRCSAW